MRLRHARRSIELHTLRSQPGVDLLVLHSQFGSATEAVSFAEHWPGPVHALDFPGHGASEWLEGGAYCPEHLVASADLALQQIDAPIALVGVGLGAYVGLLLAGGRADRVGAALLLPGRGLEGGGPEPNPVRELPTLHERLATVSSDHGNDPLVVGLDLFCRPPEYAARFAAAARRLHLVEDGEPRPPWWEAARRSPNAITTRGHLAALLAALHLAAT